MGDITTIANISYNTGISLGPTISIGAGISANIPGGGGGATSRILTEAGDALVTEGGDHLVLEP